MLKLSSAPFALAFLFGSGVPFLAHAAESNASFPPESRIAHAETVKTCGFAPVILGPRNCTATLVHPKLVICAAHCGSQIRSVSFGESTSRTGRKVEVEYCKTHPAHAGGNDGRDWSFCVLKEPVTDIPIIPPAFGCELEQFMKTGQAVTQVGYGSNAGKDKQTTGGGIKRWAENTVTEMGFSHEDNIKVGPNTKKVVACPGDSGGPLLIKMKDGSWRTMAIAIKYSGNCGGGNPFNIYARIGKAVTWIEKESKIDITPCFDSDGTWNPTKDCKGFYSGDASVQGSWASGCKEAPKSGYSSTCGDPFGESKPPEIALDAPKDGDTIKVEKLPALVKIQASIKPKVPETFAMGLVVDGEELEDTAKSKAPWTWEHKLDQGDHELALWYDIGKQKRQQSEPIEITIEQQPEESPEPTPKDPSPKDPSGEDPSPEDPSKEDPKSEEPGTQDPSQESKGNADTPKDTKDASPGADSENTGSDSERDGGCTSSQAPAPGIASFLGLCLLGWVWRRP